MICTFIFQHLNNINMIFIFFRSKSFFLISQKIMKRLELESWHAYVMYVPQCNQYLFSQTTLYTRIFNNQFLKTMGILIVLLSGLYVFLQRAHLGLILVIRLQRLLQQQLPITIQIPIILNLGQGMYRKSCNSGRGYYWKKRFLNNLCSKEKIFFETLGL